MLRIIYWPKAVLIFFKFVYDSNGDLYSITTDITSVIVDRKYSGISNIEINSENIYLFSGKFTLLPDDLNIEVDTQLQQLVF